MEIEILNVTINTIPGKKAGTSYQQAEVAYKNQSQGGKVEGKKIMSFGDSAEAFKVISTAVNGDKFVVDNKKIGDYWVWVSVSKGGAGSTAGQANAAKTFPAPKSTYETPEERAVRQRLIVRQSSLSNAIAVLKTDKTIPTKEDVVALAEYFNAFVFEDATKAATSAVSDDFEDDIPY